MSYDDVRLQIVGGTVGAEQKKSGADDGGGLQAQGALAQPRRTPAGEEKLPPFRRIEPPFRADQESAHLGPRPRDQPVPPWKPGSPIASVSRNQRTSGPARPTAWLQAWGPVISGSRERWHCSRAATATR